MNTRRHAALRRLRPHPLQGAYRRLDYQSGVTSTPQSVPQILRMAASGGQSVSLPISRIIIQLPPPAASTAGMAVAPPPKAPALGQSGGFGPAASATVPWHGRGQGGRGPAPSSAPAGFSTIIAGNEGQKFTVNIVQTEGSHSFTVKAENDFWAQNEFGITRLANTAIPTSVSNTFTSEVAADVKEVIPIITKAVSFASLLGVPAAPGAAGVRCGGGTIEIVATPRNHPATHSADNGCYSAKLSDPSGPVRQNLVPWIWCRPQRTWTGGRYGPFRPAWMRNSRSVVRRRLRGQTGRPCQAVHGHVDASSCRAELTTGPLYRTRAGAASAERPTLDGRPWLIRASSWRTETT